MMTAMLMMLPNSLWKAPQTVQQVAYGRCCRRCNGDRGTRLKCSRWRYRRASNWPSSAAGADDGGERYDAGLDGGAEEDDSVYADGATDGEVNNIVVGAADGTAGRAADGVAGSAGDGAADSMVDGVRLAGSTAGDAVNGRRC